jgi:hypothetical protein
MTPGCSATLAALEQETGVTVLRTAATIVVVVPLDNGVSGPDQLLPLVEAARLACVSPRTLREAVRRGDVPAFGKERDRAIRRADLDAWIASRKVIVRGPDDADIDRRMARLAREKASP